MKRLTRLLHCRRAATAVEYGLIVSLIVIAMVAALRTLGNTTSTLWNTVNTKMSAS